MGVWKALRSGWEALKDRIGFKVGSSNKVKFWIDKWCGDTTLRDLFLALHSSSKDAQVIDVWDGASWGPRFVRQLHDWELEVDEFFGRLYDHSIS